MAFRGRGRGYAGGGGFCIAKQEPFVLFPHIENFPDAKSVTEETTLVVLNARLQKFWKSSPYYIKDKDQGENEIPKLSHFMKMTIKYVPAELAKGSKQEKHGKEKVQWNPDSDMHKLDLFEKLEKKHQGQDEKGGKEKNEDENEEEDDEKIEESDEEFSDDGDYNQDIDFDDDEDDFNMDDNDDEAMY